MRFSFIVILFLLSGTILSQGVKDTTLNVPMLSVNFCGQKPYGDLAKRFGENLSIGGSFLFKARKTWVLGVEGGYFFGRNVKEDVLQQLKTNESFVIDNEGFPADLRVTERGFNSYLVIGKVFPKLGNNPNSGLIITCGFGYLQHKIKLYDANKKVAAVKDDLMKGYDRLSGGFEMEQFVGYLFLSGNRLVNVIACFKS